jgi:transposase-like protein
MSSTPTQHNTNPTCPNQPFGGRIQVDNQIALLLEQAQQLKKQVLNAQAELVRCKSELKQRLKELAKLSANSKSPYPYCPVCQGESYRHGTTRSGTQRYRCKSCGKGFSPKELHKHRDTRGNRVRSNPSCSTCGEISKKHGFSRTGNYQYYCRPCNHRFTFSPQRQRQHEVSKQAEQLPSLIEQKLPKNLPLEIREELQQELVMAALAGDFELSELDAAVARFRRKVNRESLTGFGYVSLDAVIPQTNGLTYADTLAG